MPNQEHLSVLKQGRVAWQKYRQKRRLEILATRPLRSHPAMSKAYLALLASQMKELGGDLSDSDLRGKTSPALRLTTQTSDMRD